MPVELFTLSVSDPPPALEIESVCIESVCNDAEAPVTNWNRNALGATATLGAPGCVTVKVTGMDIFVGLS